ncbi:phosphomevalonate kinase [Danaus plexippus]|uniref:Phosphomevalonate kinase n=1 Tax=Danaus plexippus plexippus TaxID=278856 RepID=A0A212FAT1_DANPL|nr:phosphomevalonate kinase [Danaus plexippus]XP_061379496.1 phosphomevalonate kinase [Danaus plexippus]XP_061379497.1 phosphomevalonate kinase [Danaus plexippus]OWR50846.1 phosphomevalonate kinase [Danaus plexippus plexippus]
MSPKVILLFSGKRKCGKDFVTDHLKEKLDGLCEVIKISQPIKSHWAKEKNLSLKDLLSDGEYKELFRLELIKWSEEMRDKDYGYFCRAACQNAADKPVWIVSDIRRKTDIKWFKESYGECSSLKTIRLTADLETRKQRGYKFASGIDDAASECDLDDFNEWDLVINNGKERDTLEKQLNSIMTLLPTL